VSALSQRVVIVGAGQAGRWVALTLREQGHTGPIHWFGDEAHAPYDRPPLSKAAIQGEIALDALALIPPAKFGELRVDFRPGQRVASIDRERKVVRTEAGDEAAYDLLFLAHGGRARTLPGVAPHARIATLRSYEDALAIKLQLASAQHVLVLGGGWIGLELAASSRKLGKRVTVLEAAPRLCIRTVPPCVSEHLLALHRGQDVDVRLGDGVQSVAADEGGVSVTLASGAVLRGDLLVVGIGLVANDQMAATAGIECSNGVLTDVQGRTSDPSIFAVGDVANSLRADGTRARIESWENAQRQAVTAAKAALGIAHDDAAEGPPWFWSDQYDDNLQLLGVPTESMRVIERAVPARRQRVFFFCEDTHGQASVRAVAAVNAGREIKIAKRWLQQGKQPASLDSLADTTIDLNKLPLKESPR
jgi:3-phenylpropionate/trans-cinnamate dioxygenase ferredoxin reductase component